MIFGMVLCITTLKSTDDLTRPVGDFEKSYKNDLSRPAEISDFFRSKTFYNVEKTCFRRNFEEIFEKCQKLLKSTDGLSRPKSKYFLNTT